MNSAALIDAGAMRTFAGQFPTGVAVITAATANGECAGLTMNSVTSLSVNPPMFVVCVDNTSNTLRAIRDAERFCINYLAHDQHDISRIFASKRKNKWESVPYRLSDLGNPLIEGVVAYGECKVHAYYKGGDHTIVIGAVERADSFEREPLVYHRGGFVSLAASD